MFLPVVAYRGYAVRRTVRAGPDHVRAAELFDDLARCHLKDVFVKVDIVEVFVPLDGKDLVSTGFKRLPDGPRSREKFKDLHVSAPFLAAMISPARSIVQAARTIPRIASTVRMTR